MPQGGFLASTAFGYKLSKDGVLEYGYAIPLAAPPVRSPLAAEFNSFINQANELELVNTGSSPMEVAVAVRSYNGQNLFSSSAQVAAHGARRISLPLPADTYGLVQLTPSASAGAELLGRTYVTRGSEYVLSYPARPKT